MAVGPKLPSSQHMPKRIGKFEKLIADVNPVS